MKFKIEKRTQEGYTYFCVKYKEDSFFSFRRYFGTSGYIIGDFYKSTYKNYHDAEEAIIKSVAENLADNHRKRYWNRYGSRKVAKGETIKKIEGIELCKMFGHYYLHGVVGRERYEGNPLNPYDIYGYRCRDCGKLFDKSFIDIKYNF